MHGLYEGEGVAYYKDGNVYTVSSCTCNLLSSGVFARKVSNTFLHLQGSFSEGLMHGTGTYTWTDGVIYEVRENYHFNVFLLPIHPILILPFWPLDKNMISFF